MLSKSSIKAIKFVVTGCKLLKVLPYEWDSKTDELRNTKSRSTKIILLCCCCFLWFESVYQFTVLYKETGDSTVPFDAYLDLFIHSSTRLTANMFQTWIIRRRKEITQLMNQVFRLNNRYKKLYNSSMIPDTCRKPLWGFSILVFIHPFAVMFTYIGAYHNRKFWSAVVIPPSILPFTVPVFALIELYISIFANVGVGFLLITVLTYLSTTNAWIGLLNDKRIDLRGHDETERSIYRTLQVFNTMYNRCLKLIWAFGLSALLIDHVLANSCLIRLVFVVPLPGYLVFPLASFVFFWFERTVFSATGFMLQVSKDFQRNKILTRNKEQKTFARSYRTLAVEAGSFFHMQRATSFTFLDAVLTYTVNLLIAS